MLACWACGTTTNAREDAWSLPVLYCPPCYNHFWDLAVEADNKIERKPVPRPRTRMSTRKPMIDDEGPTLGASSPKPAKRRKRVTFVEPSSSSEPKLDVEHIRKIAVQLDQLTRTAYSYRFKLQRRYRKLLKLQERGRASDASSFLALDMLMAKNKHGMKLIEDSFKVTQELLDRVERGRATIYDYGIMKKELVKIKYDLLETQRLVNEVKQFSEEMEAETPTTKAKVKEQAKATTERTVTPDLCPEDPPEMKREHETSTAAEKKKQLVESHREILKKLKHLSALNKEREELEMQIQLRDLFRLIDENQSVLEQFMDAEDFQRLEKKWLEKFRKICAANDLGVPSRWGDEGTEEDIARRAWQKQTEKFLENVERSKYSTSSDSSDSSKKSLGDVREEERVHRSVQDDKGISQEEKIERMERDLETAEQLMRILRELEKLDVANSTERNDEILRETRRRLAAKDLIERLEGMKIDEDRTCSSSYQMPETPESLCQSDDSCGNDKERPSSAEPERSSDSLANLSVLVGRIGQENIAMDRIESRMGYY
ncbi:calponin homology domain-containing protein DDB_G0272472-like [Trichogramma pretiosum]|uniref:calponin homology domain-containing protein DDB_G0272472-like n=1 Tax=Trichogramma pretiosum TaxID=7493 RepID=UPI0006C9A561|nr:calponin homology domain-containing protein DDB_G0272472-like [Trichogramma pretiosum]